MSDRVTEIPGLATSHEKLTPGDAVTVISAGLLADYDGAFATMKVVAALFTCEDNDVNFTLDGSNPTAAAGTNVGHNLASGDSYMIRGKANVENFKCIDRVSGSAGTVKVTVFHAFNVYDPEGGPG